MTWNPAGGHTPYPANLSPLLSSFRPSQSRFSITIISTKACAGFNCTSDRKTLMKASSWPVCTFRMLVFERDPNDLIPWG